MASSTWQDSEPSDDGSHLDPQFQGRKRSSRACDQCRKTKSKCERPSPDADQCKSCAAAGIACTFLGPSYKRGPPKGYIHAIEQRWHQVESLLGAVLACPDSRAQSIIADLRRDELAREILNRVDNGPFGPSGRILQPSEATKEDLFASILRSHKDPSQDPSRSRRQSRVSREIVSTTQDPALLAVPTPEWQDQLAARLARGSSYASTSLLGGQLSSAASTLDSSATPFTQRRRVGDVQMGASGSSMEPNWNAMYTMDTHSDEEDYDVSTEAADGVGQLSLDENQEIRYHGKASGLPLLGRSDRTDNRNEGGIWKLPMARVWPAAAVSVGYYLGEADVNVKMPSLEEQDRLIMLYFTHVHPNFPVLHEEQFMTAYNAKKYRLQESIDNTPSPPLDAPEVSQAISKLLLVSMFAIASRYSEEPPELVEGSMWEFGCNYLDDARSILNNVFHRSRAATCKALLILGHREFGIGSMEQAWLYIGMAIRMAHDLGLNRNADNWKFKGADLFSATEKQSRKQIWWTCCTADKCASVYMGRPVSIGESDYDTPLPDINPEEDSKLWIPEPADVVKTSYIPAPGRIVSVQRADGTLSVIFGSIMSLLYPVRSVVRIPRRTILANLESRLDQWYIDLPDELRFDPAMKRNVPAPHVLFLHIKYWTAVLLLHRAFVPNWREGTTQTHTDTASLKAFDLAQSAASHISSTIALYQDNYRLRYASPFLAPYLFNAGIMHVVTLTLRPSNLQAVLGLQQLLAALNEMEVVWPSARRAWELLHGAKVRINTPPTASGYQQDRNKRPAEDAFGGEKSSDFLQRTAFDSMKEKSPTPPYPSGVQDMSTRIMAHMLGLDIPGIEASTSYYPGYEWWPRTSNDLSAGTSPTSAVSPSTSMAQGDFTVPAQPAETIPLPPNDATDAQVDEWYRLHNLPAAGFSFGPSQAPF